MTKPHDANTSSHPPIWKYLQPQSEGTAGPKTQRPEGAPPRPFPAWREMRRPLWIEIRYQGGASTGEVHVMARGWKFVFPWDTPVGEVLKVINVGKMAMVKREDS